jgi:hypothetical protein
VDCLPDGAALRAVDLFGGGSPVLVVHDGQASHLVLDGAGNDSGDCDGPWPGDV